MKKPAAFLTALCLVLLWLIPAGATPAMLNQRMATRSGPGTQYTEELGTLPQETGITLIYYVQDKNQVPWGMVEFYKNNQLHRAYTGMKRVNALGNVTFMEEYYTPAVAMLSTVAYFGPGTHYAARPGQVSAGTSLMVVMEENGYLLCEYRQGQDLMRGYVDINATSLAPPPTAMPVTPAPVTPAPITPAPVTPVPFTATPIQLVTATPIPVLPHVPSTGGFRLTEQSGGATLTLKWEPVPGAQEYLVRARQYDTKTTVWAMSVSAPEVTIQNLPQGKIYSVEIIALSLDAQGGAVSLASGTVYHAVP